MMAYITSDQFKALLKKQKERKEKRKIRAKNLWGKTRALTTSQMKKKLWTLVSMYVRIRDKRANNGLCAICKARPIECAYHICPSNDGSATRWDLDNIVGACNGCNCGENYHRFKYAEKHRQLFGAKYDALVEKSKQIVQYKLADYEALYQDIKAKLEAMNGD